ncbi:MAG: thymidine phosphorylase [Chloroflexi bacterium]|nr:MAG: thymidine phosphorylase [Phototrophicales bacterium]RMF80582.1 MAG: thymidine phosphorylase [Chloroflexota bacterium]
MRAIDIIEKKRDGLSLSEDEIKWFVDAYVRDEIPDYQAAAFLMAVYLRGMSREETVHLTMAMAHSGDVLDLSGIIDYAVDKHSSGGVGDKTTLVVLPLVAACGVPVAKMSGRGLGFSGGTLDKLESIPGYNVNLTETQFLHNAKDPGIVLAGQTRQLAPADGKLYALRDVTATVSSLPLIASSIMSKKIAAGAQGIVLDVKVGRGAFMTNLEQAKNLAQIMVDIGVDAGRDMVAVISDMNQPLGVAVGNALEMAEAVETLHGGGPKDFREHCLKVAGHMLELAGRGRQWTEGDEVRSLLIDKLENGQALAKFKALVAAQGGDVRVIDDPTLLPQTKIVEAFKSKRDGYLSQVAADDIAWAAFGLGAGREKKGDPIDLAVGLKIYVNVGDRVAAGDTLATIYANDESKLEACRQRLQGAFAYSDTPVEPLPLFYDTLYGKQASV